MPESKDHLVTDRLGHGITLHADFDGVLVACERVQPDVVEATALGRLAYPRGDDAIALFAELNNSCPRVNDVKEPRRFQCRYPREQPHCIEQAPSLMLRGVVWPVGDDAVEGLKVRRFGVFLHSLQCEL